MLFGTSIVSAIRLPLRGCLRSVARGQRQPRTPGFGEQIISPLLELAEIESWGMRASSFLTRPASLRQEIGVWESQHHGLRFQRPKGSPFIRTDWSPPMLGGRCVVMHTRGAPEIRRCATRLRRWHGREPASRVNLLCIRHHGVAMSSSPAAVRKEYGRRGVLLLAASSFCDHDPFVTSPSDGGWVEDGLETICTIGRQLNSPDRLSAMAAPWTSSDTLYPVLGISATKPKLFHAWILRPFDGLPPRPGRDRQTSKCRLCL